MSPADLYRRYGHVARQFVKFGIVGGAGVLVNMVVAVVMNKLHGGTQHAQDILWSLPGTAYNLRFTSVVWIAGFLVANLFNFQLNRSWTFRDTKAAPWLAEFWPFLAVGSVAALVGLFIKDRLHQPDFSDLPARALVPRERRTGLAGVLVSAVHHRDHHSDQLRGEQAVDLPSHPWPARGCIRDERELRCT